MTTGTLRLQLDLTKDSDEQLKLMLKKANAIPPQQWTYQHFLMACRVHLQILEREGTIDGLYDHSGKAR